MAGEILKLLATVNKSIGHTVESVTNATNSIKQLTLISIGNALTLGELNVPGIDLTKYRGEILASLDGIITDGLNCIKNVTDVGNKLLLDNEKILNEKIQTIVVVSVKKKKI